MAKTDTPKWTEIEHLPEWDEEFYFVYTAKKHGKWVMLKTLRPEYASDPEMQEMIEQEFDTRYNLAHPNIIMINDFEEVEGIGRCIITDDVYGLSMRKLINQGKVNKGHIYQLTHQLVDALQYIQANHIVHPPLSLDNIIFTEKVENLKLIDVGFEQKPSLTPSDVSRDVYNYGTVLRLALDAAGSTDSRLRRIADRCANPDPKRRYQSVEAIKQAIDGRANYRLYLAIVIAFLIVVGVCVAILQSFLPK